MSSPSTFLPPAPPRRWPGHVLALAAALLVACSVDNVTFNNGDGGGSGTGADAAPGPVTMVLSTTSVTVTEGTTTTFTVGLSGPPLEPILINLTPSDDLKLGVTPAALLFSLDDWQAAQEVTLTGRADSDTVDEALTIAVASAMITDPAEVAVTVDDDDGLALLVTPTTLDLGEGGTAPLMVRLSAQPPADVVVDVASSNTAVVTVNPAQLTFTDANWAAPQMVTAFGAQDADTVNSSASIDFTATAAALTPVGLGVQVTDDDVLGISLSTTAVTVTEGGTQGFSVSLTQQPASNLTVTLASAAPGVATVNPATLTFSQANWNQPQAATIGGVDDVDTDAGATTVSASASGLSTRTISVNVTDPDVQSLSASPTSVALTEGGATGATNVRLAFRPSGNVTVSAASLAPGVATVAPASLTFTPANYDTAQPVTIIPTSDPDAADGATTVRLQDAASGLTRDVAVTVDDDEVLLLEVSATAVAVAEGGTASFGVRLTAQPAATTTVSITSADPGAVSATPSLSFSTANWNTFQTVTVTGVEDVDLAADSVALQVSSAGLPTATVNVTTTDNDTQALQLSTGSLAISEGGTGTFTVRLAFQPSGTVTVNLASTDPGAAGVSPATLSFGPANYATPQLVTVTGVQDADIQPETATISVTGAGAPGAAVSVSVAEDDQQQLVVSTSSLAFPETTVGGVSVSLAFQPVSTTTVTVSTSNAAVANPGPTTLTFTTANWSTPQVVSVSTTLDADYNFATATLTFASAGLTSRNTVVTIVEPDILELTPTSGWTCPFDNNTTSLRLRGNPINDLVVTAMEGSVEGSVFPAARTFTAVNFGTFQTFTVGGSDGPDSIQFTFSTSTVPGVTPRTYNLTVRSFGQNPCNL